MTGGPAGAWQDRAFADFPSFTGAGDCIVLNDSRAFPSRLYGVREHGTGGRVEIFLDASDFDGRG